MEAKTFIDDIPLKEILRCDKNISRADDLHS
jgi:hypothetical protein